MLVVRAEGVSSMARAEAEVVARPRPQSPHSLVVFRIVIIMAEEA